MTLPFKPHVLALLCSMGILAASGVLYVKSQTPAEPAAAPATPAAPPAVADAPAQPAPAAQPTYTAAQITQWVAPVALYPDSLLSQVLMASTYPTNVLQAVQWSHDNPTMKGDAAVQAVASQPWDPSVKSLVAFPPLLALMGEDPEWVQNLGNAFLAQPQDVMNAVQNLRALAQQTGTLKSTPQQKVTTVKHSAPATTSGSTTVTTAPATQVIKIESADPQVVYVPSYNSSSVYGTWPYASYPPVNLPPPPGQQFTDSFVKGFGYSLGVATTYALFSSIDWDDDDHHHDDDYHHDDGWHGGGNNNINVNVNNYNHITGQNINGNTVPWQHNPAYRYNVPYPNNVNGQSFHRTDVAGGLSATQQPAANLNNQRQAAAAQLHNTHTPGGLSATQNTAANRDNQRQAAMKQFQQHTGSNAQHSSSTRQIAQRNNYRGYDGGNQGANVKAHQQNLSGATQHRAQNLSGATQQHPPLNQTQRANAQQWRDSHRSNAFAGNDSRSPSWQAQQQRGQQSRQLSGLNGQQREHLSEHRELRHR